MSTTVRPSSTLIASSVVVLAGSLFLLANSIAALAVTWDGVTMIGGMVLMPLALALCIQQYRGTFCRAEKPARFTALMLAILGAFAALFTIGTLAEFRSAEYEVPWLLFALLAALSLGSLAAARSNFRWAAALQEQPTAVVVRVRRDIAAGVAAAVVTVLLTVYLVQAMPPRFAEHADYDAPPFGIPPQATDICFCRGPRGTIAYEFTIDEAGFRQWFDGGIGTVESAADEVPLRRIDKPFTVTRYTRLASDLEGPEKVTVDHGLCYRWSRDDRLVEAVYDSSDHRAYYYHRTY